MDMCNRLEMLCKQNEVALRKSNKCKTESFSFFTLPLLFNFFKFFPITFFMIKQNRIAYFKSFLSQVLFKSTTIPALSYLLVH